MKINANDLLKEIEVIEYHNAKDDVYVTKECFFHLIQNKIINPMNIKEQITALRAYLEILSQGDNISKKQIEMFSNKIETLFSTLEGFDLDNLEEELSNVHLSASDQPQEKNVTGSTVDLSSFDDFDDELPF